MSKDKKQKILNMLTGSDDGDSSKDPHLELTLMRSMEYGDEPHRIFTSIVQLTLEIKKVVGVGLYLPRESSEDDEELIAIAGDFVETEPGRRESTQGAIAEALSQRLEYFRKGNTYFFEIMCLGAPIGALAIQTKEDLGEDELTQARYLAHHAAVTHERMRLTRTLQHFLDRVEVLNELNQLIASNVSSQKVIRQVSRESAFRFAADVSLTYILDEDGETLRLKGGYGCSPEAIPKEFIAERGIFGQLMRLRGSSSIHELAKKHEPQLEFLTEFGIRSVHACCLEVRGQIMGILVVAFKKERKISHQELTRLEEFCQGAAVAIENTRSQERIVAYTERLEELVEKRTADLAVQTDKAEKANEAKSRFLANMSHELRTPLTAILGYSSVLMDGIFGSFNEKQAEALGAIVKSSDHLKRLINDVLNLARIESGKEEVSPESVNLFGLLEQLYKLMMQQAVEKGINLKPASLSKELAEAQLFVDSKHIRQVVINLLSNGIKYTPHGGTVELSAELVADKVKISVKDTGVGVPPEKLDSLFERFERGENEYSLEQEGTGIGLNLTKQLVDINGGTIGCESELGKGSTFWIMMPRAVNEEVMPDTTILAGATNYERLDGLKILVVDDDSATRSVLQHILQASGAEVTTAENVQSGRNEFSSTAFDIVLTDLAMPVESGLELIKSIRAQNSDAAHTPILVLSACAFEKDKQNAIDAGGDKFLAKPFQPGEVIEAVHSLSVEPKKSE